MSSAKKSFTLCWHCGLRVPAKRARMESVLHTRTAAEGGPYRSLRCSGCGADNGVIENSKAVLPHPLEGLTEPTLLDRIVPRQSRELLRSAEEWWTRNSVSVQKFRAEQKSAPPRPYRQQPGPHRQGNGPKRRRPAPPPQEEPTAEPRHSAQGPSAERHSTQRHSTQRHSTQRQSATGNDEPDRAEAPREPPTPFDDRAPHELLGITEDADEATIRSAYRAALKLCHPDRVANLDPEIQELANTKSKALRRAYERLLSLRQAGG